MIWLISWLLAGIFTVFYIFFVEYKVEGKTAIKLKDIYASIACVVVWPLFLVVGTCMIFDKYKNKVVFDLNKVFGKDE